MGNRKVSEMLPALKQIAELTENRINRVSEFKEILRVHKLLETISFQNGIFFENMYNGKTGIEKCYSLLKKQLTYN